MVRTIGLMSGTSLDGVDAAWLETDGQTLGRLGPSLTLPYPAHLRSALRRLLDRAPGLDPQDTGLAPLIERLTRHHAEAVAALQTTADLIGFHGQTILHRPAERRTWQIGDAKLLADLTGIPVAHDFRSADVLAGGQGAPLVPVFHAALAAELPRPLAVLNIGGVSNLTWIGPAGELVAFDAGPGNGPLDDWVRLRTGAPFDADGALALAGDVDEAVLARLMRHPYFDRPPPKSLDRLDFGAAIAASGMAALPVEDGAATLVAFIAHSVAVGPLPGRPLRWLVTGGGRRNPAIMRALEGALTGSGPDRGESLVAPVEAVGWDGDALEAQCFGFLAARVTAGLPLTFPGTTGVAAPLPGGRLAPA